jgi:hypothetical protein
VVLRVSVVKLPKKTLTTKTPRSHREPPRGFFRHVSERASFIPRRRARQVPEKYHGSIIFALRGHDWSRLLCYKFVITTFQNDGNVAAATSAFNASGAVYDQAKRLNHRKCPEKMKICPSRCEGRVRIAQGGTQCVVIWKPSTWRLVAFFIFRVLKHGSSRNP